MSYNFPRNPFAVPRLAFGDRRRRRQAAPNQNQAASGPPTLEKIADPEVLLAGFYRYKAKGFRASGLDGITCNDLGPSEAAAAARAYAREIRARRWRPQPAREVEIAKTGGGYRTLRLRVTMDRIVAMVLAEALTAMLDRYFLPSSFGFRPRKNIWQMLAQMEAIMVEDDRWVIATADITKAFDNVRIADVMDDYRGYFQDEGIYWLIETVLRGHEGSRRTLGIDQGDALSPVTLNLRLHHGLDLSLQSAADPAIPPWFRYVDDLTYVCQSELEGHQAIDLSRQLLAEAGFELGKIAGPLDLRREGARIDILGFLLRRGPDGQPRLELGRKAGQKLERALERAHLARSPSQAAREAVLGWLGAGGPAYESVEASVVLAETCRIAARMGFRDTLLRSELIDAYCNSRSRWIDLRQSVQERIASQNASDDDP